MQTRASSFGPRAGSLPEQTPRAKLLVGASGYSYPEWVEAGVYPAGTQAVRMLECYARLFPIVELNYTWYQMPKADAVERQRRQAPAGFRFAAKLTRTLTHEIASDWRAQAARYREGIAPLAQARQLAAVLVQLPPDFERTGPRRSHLAALLDELAGLPLAVEFRHASWAHDRVFGELQRRHVALAAVDEPALPGLFPALDVVTNPDFFYVRFHGRNARAWRSGRMQQKFDYDYREDELRAWVEGPIERMAGKTGHGYLFFNNHVRGQAPKNARELLRLLCERGLA